MRTESEYLNSRLERLAMVLDEIMPQCADLVRDARDLLENQKKEIDQISDEYIDLRNEVAKMPKIVMCKNCKNIQNDGWCKYYNHSEEEDWFCADGKSREMTTE